MNYKLHSYPHNPDLRFYLHPVSAGDIRRHGLEQIQAKYDRSSLLALGTRVLVEVDQETDRRIDAEGIITGISSDNIEISFPDRYQMNWPVISWAELDEFILWLPPCEEDYEEFFTVLE